MHLTAYGEGGGCGVCFFALYVVAFPMVLILNYKGGRKSVALQTYVA